MKNCNDCQKQLLYNYFLFLNVRQLDFVLKYSKCIQLLNVFTTEKAKKTVTLAKRQLYDFFFFKCYRYLIDVLKYADKYVGLRVIFAGSSMFLFNFE